MTYPTPLLSRITERRNKRVGPSCPVQLDSRRSEFSKRLAEKRLPVQDRTSTIYNGAFVPADDGGAA